DSCSACQTSRQISCQLTSPAFSSVGGVTSTVNCGYQYTLYWLAPGTGVMVTARPERVTGVGTQFLPTRAWAPTGTSGRVSLVSVTLVPMLARRLGLWQRRLCCASLSRASSLVDIHPAPLMVICSFRQWRMLTAAPPGSVTSVAPPASA